MTRHDFITCDDCGRQVADGHAFTIERPAHTLTLEHPEERIDACSTACLVRLSNELHHIERP